jgi:hypothetical protein
MRLWGGLAVAVALVAACAPRPQAPVVPSPPPDLPSPSASPAPTPTPQPPPPPPTAPQALRAAGDGVADFTRDVQPILVRTCTPCHFPGGKMYAPMPFDDAATVAAHEEGVLRRLKGSDRTTAERWFAATR